MKQYVALTLALATVLSVGIAGFANAQNGLPERQKMHFKEMKNGMDKAAMMEKKAGMKAQMREKMDERLQSLVEEGTLTQAEVDTLKSIHAKLEAKGLMFRHPDGKQGMKFKFKNDRSRE